MTLSKKTDYTTEGQGRLLSTLQGDPKLDGLIAAYLDRCQELEDVAYEVIRQRGIDTAEGHRLDRIGGLVGIRRGGRDDDTYRLRIRAEIAILNSDGLAEDLITILGLLLGLDAPFDVELTEAFPKTVILRPRDHRTTKTDADLDIVLDLLRRGTSAGTDIELVYSQNSDTDSAVFHFSTVADTTQSSASYGTESGYVSGAAL